MTLLKSLVGQVDSHDVVAEKHVRNLNRDNMSHASQ